MANKEVSQTKATPGAQNWSDDNNTIRWAFFGAIIFHILLFFFNPPSWSRPIQETDTKKPPPKIVRIMPPQLPDQPPPPKKKKMIEKRRLVPVPDPTPDEPEPIREPEPEPEPEPLPPDTEFIIGTPQGPPAPAGPIEIDASVVPPVILKKVRPKYPEMARRAGVQGTVVLRAVIHEDGAVSNIEVVKSLGKTGCDEAAIEALSQYQFAAATQNGVKVPVYMTLEVRFSLR